MDFINDILKKTDCLERFLLNTFWSYIYKLKIYGILKLPIGFKLNLKL